MRVDEMSEVRAPSAETPAVEQAADGQGSALPAEEIERLTSDIVAALKTVYDPEIPAMVENAVASVPGVGEVKVNLVWDPPWDPSRMSDEARVALNMW